MESRQSEGKKKESRDPLPVIGRSGKQKQLKASEVYKYQAITGKNSKRCIACIKTYVFWVFDAIAWPMLLQAKVNEII